MADPNDPWAGGHASTGTSRSVVGHGRPERQGNIPAVGQPEQLRLQAEAGRAKTMVPWDWRARTVVSVPVAAGLLGLSRQGAYDAASRAELPAIRIGRRLIVPVVKLRRLLGELRASDEAGGARWGVTTMGRQERAVDFAALTARRAELLLARTWSVEAAPPSPGWRPLGGRGPRRRVHRSEGDRRVGRDPTVRARSGCRRRGRSQS